MIVSREPGTVNKLKPSAPVFTEFWLTIANQEMAKRCYGAFEEIILYIVPVNSHFDRVLIFEFPAGQGAV